MYRSTLKHCCYTSHRNTKIYLSFSFVLDLWSHGFKFILFSVCTSWLVQLHSCSLLLLLLAFPFKGRWILCINPVPIPSSVIPKLCMSPFRTFINLFCPLLFLLQPGYIFLPLVDGHMYSILFLLTSIPLFSRAYLHLSFPPAPYSH